MIRLSDTAHLVHTSFACFVLDVCVFKAPVGLLFVRVFFGAPASLVFQLVFEERKV